MGPPAPLPRSSHGRPRGGEGERAAVFRETAAEFPGVRSPGPQQETRSNHTRTLFRSHKAPRTEGTSRAAESEARPRKGHSHALWPHAGSRLIRADFRRLPGSRLPSPARGRGRAVHTLPAPVQPVATSSGPCGLGFSRMICVCFDRSGRRKSHRAALPRRPVTSTQDRSHIFPLSYSDSGPGHAPLWLQGAVRGPLPFETVDAHGTLNKAAFLGYS